MCIFQHIAYTVLYNPHAMHIFLCVVVRNICPCCSFIVVQSLSSKTFCTQQAWWAILANWGDEADQNFKLCKQETAPPKGPSCPEESWNHNQTKTVSLKTAQLHWWSTHFRTNTQIAAWQLYFHQVSPYITNPEGHRFWKMHIPGDLAIQVTLCLQGAN